MKKKMKLTEFKTLYLAPILKRHGLGLTTDDRQLDMSAMTILPRQYVEGDKSDTLRWVTLALCLLTQH